MWTREGGLLRTSRNGQAKIAAFLEDYAMLVRGLISIHEATGESQWLDYAQELVGQARERFWDVESAAGSTPRRISRICSSEVVVSTTERFLQGVARCF